VILADPEIARARTMAPLDSAWAALGRIAIAILLILELMK